MDVWKGDQGDAPRDILLLETHTASSASGDGSASTAPPSSGPDPQPGDLLGGRYELLELLGVGGMGRVFRARDRVADEVIALKLLLRPGAGQLEQLRRELRGARKVLHPGVVRLHDLLEIDGRLALSMEYVAGESLKSRLERGPFAPAALASLADDLAKAVAAAHAVGVVHRDVKPANVMLRADDGHAVVTDFGVSRIDRAAGVLPVAPVDGSPAEVTHVGLAGTPLYMAPEQLCGEPVGPQADLYALGLVLYEAATGQVPHRESSLVALRSRRAEEPAPPLASVRPDVAPRLCEMVDRCLMADPARRFASGAALVAFLTEAVPRRRPSALRVLGWLAVALLPVVVPALGWLATLPAERRVVVRVRPSAEGQPVDAAVRSLVGARLLERRVVLAGDGVANVELTVQLTRDSAGVTLVFEGSRRPGFRRTLARGAGPSVDAALDAALPPLAARLAGPPPPPAPLRFGARSAELLARYERAVTTSFASMIYDSEHVRAEAEALIALDPGWPHPWALLLLEEGEGTPGRKEIVARLARTKLDSGRDPLGVRLLAFYSAPPALRAPLVAELVPLARQQPDDVVLGWSVAEALTQEDQLQGKLALLQLLHDRRPDLQFGADIAQLLRALGHDQEADHHLAAWAERFPHVESASAAVLETKLRNRQFAEAARLVNQMVLLYGDSPSRTAQRCDAYLASGELAEARTLARRLVAGERTNRAQGWRRLGEIAILEGDFSSAHQSLQAAIGDGRSLGLSSEAPYALASLRAIAPIVEGEAARQRYGEELARRFDALGNTRAADLTRLDLRLSQGRCPDPGHVRITGRAQLRVLAAHGCVPCEEVVRAGLAPYELDAESLMRFGRCAVAAGAPDLARRAFEQAAGMFALVSSNYGAYGATYHSVLARLRLAEVAAAEGDRARATALVQSFLAAWGHADRPLPEVALARRHLTEWSR